MVGSEQIRQNNFFSYLKQIDDKNVLDDPPINLVSQTFILLHFRQFVTGLWGFLFYRKVNHPVIKGTSGGPRHCI